MSVLQFFPLSELGACAQRQAGFVEIISATGSPQCGQAVFQFASPAAAAAALHHFAFHFRAFRTTMHASATTVTVCWSVPQPVLC